MKIDSSAMAEKSKEMEYFSPGNHVKLTKITGEEVVGEVLSFDVVVNALMLKVPSEKHHGQHSIEFVHLDYVKHLEALKHLESEELHRGIFPPPLPYISTSKVMSRMQQAIEDSKKRNDYVGQNVPPEGQLLMDSISKTIQEVKWKNDTIIVMDSAMITPPYTVDQLTVIPGKDCTQSHPLMTHIRKLMEQHYKKQKKEQMENDTRHSTSTSPSPTSSASSAS